MTIGVTIAITVPVAVTVGPIAVAWWQCLHHLAADLLIECIIRFAIQFCDASLKFVRPIDQPLVEFNGQRYAISF